MNTHETKKFPECEASNLAHSGNNGGGATLSEIYAPSEAIISTNYTHRKGGIMNAPENTVPTFESIAALADAALVQDDTTTLPQGEDAAEIFSRLPIYTAADALKPQPPIDWVIPNLLSAGSLAFLVGDGGTKKTWLLLDASVCVAAGKQWLGFPVKERQPVLWIDEESGARRWLSRLGDTIRGQFIDRAPPDIPVQAHCMAGFNLTKKNWLDVLHLSITASGARLVIIDAWADIVPGADENDAGDATAVLHTLRSIAETTRCAFLMVHHTNKNGNYRGTTALKAGCDLMLSVTNEGLDKIVIKTEKARDFAPLAFAARANFTPGQFWLSSDDHHPAHTLTERQAFVLKYLYQKDDKTATRSELLAARGREDAGTPKENIGKHIDRAIEQLRNRNLIKNSGRGQYVLTPQGEKAAEKRA